MDNNNPNRLYLNFGNNDNKFVPDSRTYPTTPSTFPNPIFQSQGQGAQQAHPQSAQQQQQQQQQQYAAGYGGGQGYFMNNPYPPSYAHQGQPAYPQAPQAAYQQRPAPASNDPTNGLVHQFSHQNLGGGRASPYGAARQPAPATQRPRTAGAPGQAGYGGYLNAPMPSQSAQQNWPEFQVAPERNPDKYGPVAQNNQKNCERMASDFFKDSVKRARDRNVR
jgi:protein-serine/threonine kinase